MSFDNIIKLCEETNDVKILIVYATKNDANAGLSALMGNNSITGLVGAGWDIQQGFLVNDNTDSFIVFCDVEEAYSSPRYHLPRVAYFDKTCSDNDVLNLIKLLKTKINFVFKVKPWVYNFRVLHHIPQS